MAKPGFRASVQPPQAPEPTSLGPGEEQGTGLDAATLKAVGPRSAQQSRGFIPPPHPHPPPAGLWAAPCANYALKAGDRERNLPGRNPIYVNGIAIESFAMERKPIEKNV